MAYRVLALVAVCATAGTADALDNGAARTPALGWSTWNAFNKNVSDALVRESAAALVSSGLAAAGYTYVNIDDGWACERDAATNELIPCAQLPNKTALGDHLHGLGLKFGLYTVWGQTTCASTSTRAFHGSWGHERQDAATFARWGCDYLKEDSCGGPFNGTLWEAYSLMRDGLNATGRSIYFSITQQFGRCNKRADGKPGCATGGGSPGAVPSWNPTPKNGHIPLAKAPPHLSMECFEGAFTPLPWRQQGLHPTDLANSWLVEYCNNGARFGSTLGSGGSLLSQLDSQADWTIPELASPGGFNDMDMLEVCHPEWTLDGKPDVEGWKAEFALWSVLASPIILGNDIRSMSKECLAIVTNSDILAVHQDPAVKPYRMLWQSMPQLQYGQDDVQQIFARTMADGDEAVIMFNRFTSPRNISLHWEQLGLHPPWRPCAIRDLHNHTILAAAQKYRITLRTPAHGVQALRFRCGKAAAGTPPKRAPPLPPAHPIEPPPPPWDPPPVLAFGLEVQPCGAPPALVDARLQRQFNASTQRFTWRDDDRTLRLTSNTELCVTYLGHDTRNVGVAVCHGGGSTRAWAEIGVGAQIWARSNATAGSSSYLYSACQPNGTADTSRCFNVIRCNVSTHAFEVGDKCSLAPGCDQRWRMEGGLVRTAADGYRSCLTLGAPKR